MEIEAPPEEHDRLLLEEVLPLCAAAPHSFLRANKPTWRILIDRHSEPLSADAGEEIADSRAALAIIRLDHEGQISRGRREIVLASIVGAVDRKGLTREERVELHRSGYLWAIENGRWDRTAVDGIEARFLERAQGLADFVASARRGENEAFGGRAAREIITERWRTHPPNDSLRRALDRHANRLGVFAEPVAILHYFLWRLAGGVSGPPHA